MNKYELNYLKIRKFIITKFIAWSYRDLPFKISYCDKSNKYALDIFKHNKILAEFECNNKYFIIYE